MLAIAYYSAYRWYFEGIERVDAEKLLMQKCNPTGTFLIRESQRMPGSYSLSVRNVRTCKHYTIWKSANGEYSILLECLA